MFVQIPIPDSDGEQPLLSNRDDGSQRPGMRVTFTSLEYLLPSNVKRGEIAQVLKPMSGYFNPGEMTAVMGPSGSGKSILMDVLAGRRRTGTVNGMIRYASRIPTKSLLSQCTGYVEQFSSLIENLTVFEMLMYTAELKRSYNESTKDKKQAVEELIKKLALTSCRDIRIGDPHLSRGISGGEGKRVNIGIALITNPQVLYMDEPVSGLDSYTANEVMEVVGNLVGDGMTLCATLHSPTPFTFCGFDRILLLVQGTMVFFGSRGEVVGYFEGMRLGFFQQTQSVAEWLTEIIVKAEQDDQAPILIQSYRQSTLCQTNEQALFSETTNEVEEPIAKENNGVQAQSTPIWYSLLTLLRYRSLKNLSSLSFWITRTIDKTVIVILVCTIYHGLGNDITPFNYTNLSALMFIWTTFSASGAVIYVPRLVLERWVFYREQRDGLYPVFSYFLIKLIEEYFVAAVVSVIYSFVMWYVIDLQGKLMRFLLTFYGMFISSIVLAFFFGAVAPNIDIANALFPCYMMTLLFYAGYLLLPQNIPKYLVWYSKLDFLRYSYSALMVNQFKIDRQYEGVTAIFPPEQYLKYIGLDDVDPDWYIAILYIFTCAFGLVAYLAMHFVRYDRKG